MFPHLNTCVADYVYSGGHFGAFLPPYFDELKDLVDLRGVDLRSLFHVGEGIAHGPPSGALRATLHKLIGDGGLHENTTASATTLACESMGRWRGRRGKREEKREKKR